MRQFFFPIVFFAAFVSTSAPAQADHPRSTPHHKHAATEVREYRYVYYPEQRIYYSPVSQTWFWLQRGSWHVGVHLPRQYQLNTRATGIPVMLQSPRPYVEHVYVEEKYGRPWREKRSHKGKRHNGQH